MAVKLLNKTGRGTAMVLSLATLALPGAAMAQDEEGGRRGGWHRSAETAGDVSPGGEQRREQARSQGNGGGDNNGRRAWGAPQQRMAIPQQAQAPQAQAAPNPQVRWQGGNGGGSWQGRSAPAQTAPVQTAPQTRWSGNVGGDRRSGWSGERRGGGEARTSQPTSQPTWQGRTAPQTTPQTRSGGQRGEWNTGTSQQGREQWRRDSDRRDNDRRDGNRWDGNRDRRDGDRWQGNNGSWNQNRYRDTNRQIHRDGRDWNRWNNGWRSNNRYDWFSYRRTNPSVYRWGSYYSPYRGYSYRRLSIGFFLDSLFYSNQYWINDPWQYRLPDAYGPYRWVRYYDDALLVDVYTGEVVDVIYDFFW